MEITCRPESLFRSLNPARMAGDFWEARAILRQFGLKEVSQRYRGSRLGILWIFLQPLFLLTIYTVAFGVILKTHWPESHRNTLGEVAMAVYCGLTAFGILSECAARAPMLLVENHSYVKRARFPVQMLPFCVMVSATFHALVNVVLLILLGWTFTGFYLPALLAPLMLLPVILFSASVALLLAVIGPIVRDVRHLVAPTLLALTFLTPLAYSPAIVPARLQWLVVGNPVAFSIINLRSLILWQTGCDWKGWACWTVLGVLFLEFSYGIFMRFRFQVADLV